MSTPPAKADGFMCRPIAGAIGRWFECPLAQDWGKAGERRTNTPVAEASGFGLRLKARSVGRPADFHCPKSKRGPGKGLNSPTVRPPVLPGPLPCRGSERTARIPCSQQKTTQRLCHGHPERGHNSAQAERQDLERVRCDYSGSALDPAPRTRLTELTPSGDRPGRRDAAHTNRSKQCDSLPPLSPRHS